MMKKMMMIKLFRNKEFLFVAIILLVQILAECAHLGFDGEVRRSIFWTNYRLFHFGLLPAILLYYLMTTRESKYLCFTLIVYNAFALMMEQYAILIDKEIIIKINQFWLSEFILIIISLTLSYIVHGLKNGFGLPRIINNRIHNIFHLLQRCGKDRGANK